MIKAWLQLEPFTQEENEIIRLWVKLMIFWCVLCAFCHFFVWNPIKVKEVSDLQVYKYGDIYVDQRAENTGRSTSNFSWMRLSVHGKKYQCDCTTYHCRVTDSSADKLKLDEVSFYIVNKKYCFVAETVKHDLPENERIAYSYYLKNRNIIKEQLYLWRPHTLRSDYHEKVYQFYIKLLFIMISCVLAQLHWSFFIFLLSSLMFILEFKF